MATSENSAPIRYYDPLPPALAEQLDWMIAKEGGFIQRETEPGGAGKYGVSFRQYQAWEELHGRPEPKMDQFRDMPRAVALDIYATMYAPPVWWHLLAPGVNYVMLDSAVNNGVGGAAKIAQRALDLPVTGFVGPTTLWALTHRPRGALVDILCNERLRTQLDFRHYRTVATDGHGQPVLRDGKPITWGQIWTNRVEALRKKAHALAETPAV